MTTQNLVFTDYQINELNNLKLYKQLNLVPFIEGKGTRSLYFNIKNFKQIPWANKAGKRIYRLTRDLKPDEQIVVRCLKITLSLREHNYMYISGRKVKKEKKELNLDFFFDEDRDLNAPAVDQGSEVLSPLLTGQLLFGIVQVNHRSSVSIDSLY